MTQPPSNPSELRARIICGDALEVLRGMDSKSVDMVFTDPPYGHSQNDGDLLSQIAKIAPHKNKPTHRHNALQNDGPEAHDLFRAILPELRRVLVPGGCCCCCCCGGGPDPQFARWSLWLDEVFEFKQTVVWDKGPMGMGWHYRRSYETVLVATKPGAACKWYDKSHKVENVIRARKIIPNREQHPTEKPPSLAAHFIRLHSQPGELILDPFCGSGSTGVAAIKHERRFLGIEIDPKYCRLAEARISPALAQGVLEGVL